MNWNDPQVRLSLKELQEMLAWRGRDSRLVRTAFAWSQWKKSFLQTLKYRLGRFPAAPKEGPLRILFWLPGGLGDAACAKRVVSAYRARLPQAVFDVYVPLEGVGEMLFGADKQVHILTDKHFSPFSYDLAVQACMAVKFLHVNPGRFSEQAPEFVPVLERAKQAQASLGCLLDDLFLTDGLLGRWLCARGANRAELLSYTSGVPLVYNTDEHLKTDASVREKFGLQDVLYVTFHDGTSHAQPVGHTRPTRAWPAVRWCEFFRLFKKQFPHLKLVQLGGKNSPVYEEADVCLVNKTQVGDLPALLEGALAHVDTESGLVHLAQFLNVRSVVIFGPSRADFLGYAKNENLSAGPCGGCMWTTTDWMQNCPLGHVPAPCTERVSASAALEALGKILKH